jgi:hypothetical protein
MSNETEVASNLQEKICICFYGKEACTLLGPLERANHSHWTALSNDISRCVTLYIILQVLPHYYVGRYSSLADSGQGVQFSLGNLVSDIKGGT